MGGNVTALSQQVQTDLGYNQAQLAVLLEQLQRLSEELTLLAQDLKERPWQVVRPPRPFPEARP